MDLDLFERLGVALAIGFLVGVERGWRAREVAEGRRTAGIRTYALSGLLGGVAGLLSQALGGWAFAALGGAFAAAFVIFKLREQEAGDDYSVTDIVAALLVFGLGAYATVGDWRLAAAAAVVTAGLLAAKGGLHTWLRALTWPELRSALVLLAMSFVLLPLMPDRGFGPYAAFNPRELWVLTIGLAGVSFVGYVAARMLGGARGALLGSAIGALISSTAVTFHLARVERVAPDPRRAAAAALVAGAVMAARIAAIVGVLAPPLLGRVAAPLAAFAAMSTALGLGLAFRGRDESEGTAAALKSPFDLGVVLKFALVLAVVMAAARVLSGLYGAGGLLAVSALAGLADVDAVAMTAAQMTAGGLALELGAYAVLIAAGMDSLSKCVIAWTVGGQRFGRLFLAGTAAAAAAAGGALYLVS